MRHARAQPGRSETDAGLKMTIPTTGYPPVASEPHLTSVSKIGVLAGGAGAPAETHGPPQLPPECCGISLERSEHAQGDYSPWVSLIEEETPPTSPGRYWFWLCRLNFLLVCALHLALDEPHPSPSFVLSVNGTLGPLEVVYDARGPFHRARTDRRLEKTANFRSAKSCCFHPMHC